MSKREFTMLAKVYASWLGSFRLAYLTASRTRYSRNNVSQEVEDSRVSNNGKDWRRQASGINWKRNDAQVLRFENESLSFRMKRNYAIVISGVPRSLWPDISSRERERERERNCSREIFRGEFWKEENDIIFPLSSRTFLEINISLSLSLEDYTIKMDIFHLGGRG